MELPAIIPGEWCGCCAEAIRPFSSQTCALSSDFHFFITVLKDKAARVLIVHLYVVLEAWL